MGHRSEVFSRELFEKDDGLQPEDPGYVAPAGSLRPTENPKEFADSEGNIFNERGELLRAAPDPRFPEVLEEMRAMHQDFKEEDHIRLAHEKIRRMKQREQKEKKK